MGGKSTRNEESMKNSTILKKKKMIKVKRRIRNFNKVLSKTFIITREIGEIQKCIRKPLPKNGPTNMLVDMIISTKEHGSKIKKNIKSRKFVISNIENISNSNLLKIISKKYDR
jgi:hypothetical protein